MNMDDMSGNVLQQTMVQRIGKNVDNIFVQYFLGLMAAAVIGALTSWFPDMLSDIKAYIEKYWKPRYPTITFVFSRDKASTHLSRVTNAVKAWMEQLEIIIRKQRNRQKQVQELQSSPSTFLSLVKGSRSSKLLQLRHVATGNWEDDFKDEKDHWIPNQTQDFEVDDNIWAKFEVNTLEDKKYGDVGSVDEYTLSIYSTKRENGLEHLLDYHTKLIRAYETKLKSKFENKSHIFELESYDSEEGKITWQCDEFSSSRRMEHVWFGEKKTFLSAYKNFLFNKEEYDIRGDPYTFSVLLYGPPGCGKTSLLKALVNFDKMHNDGKISHLFVVPFSKVVSIECFHKIMFNKKVLNDTEIPFDQRIYVFEDFDANTQAGVFNIRKGLNLNPNMTNRSGASGGAGAGSSEDGSESEGTDDADEDEADILQEMKENAEKASKGKNKDGKEKKGDSKEEMLDKEEKEAKDEKEQKKSQEDEKKAKAFDAIKSVFFESEDKDAKSKNKLHLSDVLNTLDGLCERTGQRSVWTTNKHPPQKYFDPAFLRPGRMDMIIKLGYCTHEGIDYLLKQYYKHSSRSRCREAIGSDAKEDVGLFGNDFDLDAKLDLSGIDEHRFTPAQVKQICKESTSLPNAIKMMTKICNGGGADGPGATGPDVAVRSGGLQEVKENENDGLEKSLESDLRLDQMIGLAKRPMRQSVSAPFGGRDLAKLFKTSSSGSNKTAKSHGGHWFEPHASEVLEEPRVVSDSDEIEIQAPKAKTGS